jgi:hypothetical protein
MPTLVIRGVDSDLQTRAESLGLKAWGLVTEGSQIDADAIDGAVGLLADRITAEGTLSSFEGHDGVGNFVAAACVDGKLSPRELLALLRELAQSSVTVVIL